MRVNFWINVNPDKWTCIADFTRRRDLYVQSIKRSRAKYVSRNFACLVTSVLVSPWSRQDIYSPPPENSAVCFWQLHHNAESQIIRDEMNAGGFVELLLPTLQPKSLWIESGRWNDDNEIGRSIFVVRDHSGGIRTGIHRCWTFGWIFKYSSLENIEVLFDDRNVRAGEKFGDADLFGIPIRLTISKRTCKAQEIELKLRNNPDSQHVSYDDALKKIHSFYKIPAGAGASMC